MRRRARIAAIVSLAPLAALVSCAGAPAAPSPGKAAVFGTLKLVPHEGVPRPSRGDNAAYQSLRVRGAELVDYSTPGFAVVFVAEGMRPGGHAALAIRDTSVAPRLDPDHVALGAGGRISIENAGRAPHILSYPAAGLVRRLAPGEHLEIEVPQEGEQGLFLLDAPDATATLFAAPGRFAVVSRSGDYELRDLEPGAVLLRAWHPRFPPVAQRVELAPDTARRVDLEMGVGIGAEASADGE